MAFCIFSCIVDCKHILQQIIKGMALFRLQYSILCFYNNAVQFFFQDPVCHILLFHLIQHMAYLRLNIRVAYRKASKKPRYAAGRIEMYAVPVLEGAAGAVCNNKRSDRAAQIHCHLP